MDKFSLYLQTDFDRSVVVLNNAIAKATVNDDRTVTFTSDYDTVTVGREVLANSRRSYSYTDNFTMRTFTVTGIIYHVMLLQDNSRNFDNIIGRLYDYDYDYDYD